MNGISKQKAIDISNDFNKQFAMRKLMLDLESYGVTPAETAAIYKYFGVNALDVIRENPYILCGSVRGFDFERAEKLTADMNLNPDQRYRNEAGLLYIVKYNLYSNGHTCIPRKKIVEPSESLLGIGRTETDETIDRLVENKRLFCVEIDGEPFLFLPDIYLAERAVAERLKRAVRFTPENKKSINADLRNVEADLGIQYAEKQLEAIKIAVQKGLLILTGGPGTGKTTTVRGIIELLEKQRVEVVLCAPTGMAAKRMSEVSERDAKTIHRLLEVEWSEDDKPVFRRNAQNPLHAGAVIVDEVSMVDVELMASLLDAVPLGCRIILVSGKRSGGHYRFRRDARRESQRDLPSGAEKPDRYERA